MQTAGAMRIKVPPGMRMSRSSDMGRPVAHLGQSSVDFKTLRKSVSDQQNIADVPFHLVTALRARMPLISCEGDSDDAGM